MAKLHTYLLMDTEAVKTASNSQNSVYDVAGCVFRRNGDILGFFNFLLAEPFYADLSPKIQSSPYLLKKYVYYNTALSMSEIDFITVADFWRYFNDFLVKYSITSIISYNISFDYNAIEKTYNSYTGKSGFFPINSQFWDLYKMAKSYYKNNSRYNNFCYDNNFLTERKMPKYTAESIYAYITNNSDYLQAHTALSDVMQEYVIFMKLLQMHKKIDKIYTPRK